MRTWTVIDPNYRDERFRSMTSKRAMPTSMAATKAIAFGTPALNDTMAGPGQKPASPQPAPKMRDPMIKRRSMAEEVGQ